MPNRAIFYLKGLVHLVCLLLLILLFSSLRPRNVGGDPIAHLTHVTGEWAIWFLLLSLAITPLRLLHPRLSNLIRLRRLLGLYAFFFATLHIATYIFLFSGYNFSASMEGLRAGNVAEPMRQFTLLLPKMVADARKRLFIPVGFAAWSVLLVLAVTSTTAMMRRLGGRRWQRLHRLAYAAAILGCIHYWWLVKPGVYDPSLETSVLAVLLVARILYGRHKKLKQTSPRSLGVS